MDIQEIARVAHEVNRAYCLATGETGIPMWQHAPDWQREGVVNGVEFYLAHLDATPEQSHENWLAHKQALGWRYGSAKDAELKEHPCMVPYGQLSDLQRAKDQIFLAVVRALAGPQP